MKTLVDLSNEGTLVVMTYEERKTGDKPKIEKRFFEVYGLITCAYIQSIITCSLQLMANRFTHRTVPLSEQDAEFSSPDIHIVLFTKIT